MEYKNLSRIKSYCIKLKKDDEFIKSLTSFCIHNKITSGFFEAIGATDNLSIG
jgi:predicted DNA-binding protein with PD1-like motif